MLFPSSISLGETKIFGFKNNDLENVESDFLSTS